jgi:heme exporter protein D
MSDISARVGNLEARATPPDPAPDRAPLPTARATMPLAIFAVIAVFIAHGVAPALQGAIVGLSDAIDAVDSLGATLTQLLFVWLTAVALGLVSAWVQSRGPFLLKVLAIALAIPLTLVVFASMALPRTPPVFHLAVGTLSGTASVAFGSDALRKRQLLGAVPIGIGLASMVRGWSSFASELAMDSHRDFLAMTASYSWARVFSTVAHSVLALAVLVVLARSVLWSRRRGLVVGAGTLVAFVVTFLTARIPPVDLASVSTLLLARLAQCLSSLPPTLFPSGIDQAVSVLPVVVSPLMLAAAPRAERSAAAAAALCLATSVNAEVPVLALCLLVGSLSLALVARDPHEVGLAVQRS